MVAQWFYPKDLKDLIAKLEAEDNLRRELLKHMNIEIIVILIISLVLLFLSYQTHSMGVAFISLISFLTAFFAASFRAKKYKPYIYGLKKKGVILNIENSYYYSRMSIKDEETEKIIRTPNLNLEKELQEQDFQDKAIMFYFLPNKLHDMAMPDIQEVKEIYCLRKDLMNDA